MTGRPAGAAAPRGVDGGRRDRTMRRGPTVVLDHLARLEIEHVRLEVGAAVLKGWGGRRGWVKVCAGLRHPAPGAPGPRLERRPVPAPTTLPASVSRVIESRIERADGEGAQGEGDTKYQGGPGDSGGVGKFRRASRH